ncbi:hypothetical protein SSS_07630 [Sarcoptes scabiei]|uniref:UPF0568 protein n=1 Tax=Sarcoptes scabiei TaxID=52283 RepID=A0A834R3F3_SARSC|nr:hypothetical protein SSS_07630 [Sarcoptes scabiei]
MLSLSDQDALRNLVYWLECIKIRFYPPEKRDTLRPDQADWNEYFQKYLNEMNFGGLKENRCVIDWLINLALRFESEDVRNQMRISKEEINNMVNIDCNSNDFAHIDVNSIEFLSELQQLAELLNIPYYEEEPLETLRAITILLCKLRKSSQQKQMEITDEENKNQNKKQKILYRIDEQILNQPFKRNLRLDPILNRCANVLRLMYVNNLRDLQTDINEVIVKLQSITANPKTDSSLGKVGRA